MYYQKNIKERNLYLNVKKIDTQFQLINDDSIKLFPECAACYQTYVKINNIN